MTGPERSVPVRPRSMRDRSEPIISAVLLVLLGAAGFLASRFGYSSFSGPGVLQFFAPAAAVAILFVVEAVAVHRAVQRRAVLPVVLLGAALLGVCVLVGVVRYDFTGFPGW